MRYGATSITEDGRWLAEEEPHEATPNDQRTRDDAALSRWLA